MCYSPYKRTSRKKLNEASWKTTWKLQWVTGFWFREVQHGKEMETTIGLGSIITCWQVPVSPIYRWFLWARPINSGVITTKL